MPDHHPDVFAACQKEIARRSGIIVPLDQVPALLSADTLEALARWGYGAETESLDTAERDRVLDDFTKHMLGPDALWPCRGWPVGDAASRYRKEFPKLLAGAAIVKGYAFAEEE